MRVDQDRSRRKYKHVWIPNEEDYTIGYSPRPETQIPPSPAHAHFSIDPSLRVNEKVQSYDYPLSTQPPDSNSSPTPSYFGRSIITNERNSL